MLWMTEMWRVCFQKSISVLLCSLSLEGMLHVQVLVVERS